MDVEVLFFFLLFHRLLRKVYSLKTYLHQNLWVFIQVLGDSALVVILWL